MISYIGAETTMLFGAGLTRAGSTKARTTWAGRVLGPHRPVSKKSTNLVETHLDLKLNDY